MARGLPERRDEAVRVGIEGGFGFRRIEAFLAELAERMAGRLVEGEARAAVAPDRGLKSGRGQAIIASDGGADGNRQVRIGEA